MPEVAIIGAGPAGLMTAEVLCEAGIEVSIYDAMPSFGRKFLMAGKSGLNITHTEDLAQFIQRYPAADPRLTAAVQAFGPADIIAWMQGLGITPYEGSTGRVFPEQMKASGLLRAWLLRLQEQGARFYRQHRFLGWNSRSEMMFQSPEGDHICRPDATLLALGGGSWKRLGSDGAWRGLLLNHGIEVSAFAPRNCGFQVDWSTVMAQKWAGAPVKNVGLSVSDQTVRGEFVITTNGVESGAVYTLSAALMSQIERQGKATLTLDLRPDLSLADVTTRLDRPQGKQSLSNHLRKAIGLEGVKRALLYEFTSQAMLSGPAPALARHLKALSIPIRAAMPLDQAISTAGGVAWTALDQQFGLRHLPGVFCAGEMIEWDAPTGGYLITACLATGRAAGQGMLAYLDQTVSPYRS